MNKRVLTTSLLLILVLILVLVIGKTEHVSDPKPAQNVAQLAPKPQIDLNTDTTIWQSNALRISSEVNESDLILEQEPLPVRTENRKSTSYLTDSLLRLQRALDELEQAAANAVQAVETIENRTSSG